jgi:hypothetical protein
VAVDGYRQVIVAQSLNNNGSDRHQMIPLVKQIRTNLGRQAKEVSAASGYCSELNLKALQQRHIRGYVATTLHRKHRKVGLSVQRMRQRLNKVRGEVDIDGVNDCGTGIRTNQTVPRVSAVSATWRKQCRRRVEFVMHRPQSAETRGSKGMSPLNRRLAPPIRGWRPSKRIRISNLCPLLFLDSDYLNRLLFQEGNCQRDIHSQLDRRRGSLVSGSMARFSVDLTWTSELCTSRFDACRSVRPVGFRGDFPMPEQGIRGVGDPDSKISAPDRVDHSTVVIGAPGAQSLSTFSGAAYVFVKRNGQWVQTSKRTGADGVTGDSFGSAVSIQAEPSRQARSTALPQRALAPGQLICSI